MKRTLWLGLALCLLSACTRKGNVVDATPEHVAEINAWHARRVAALTSPTGWLTLVGLHWLKDGRWTMGSNPSTDIGLPSHHAAGVIGTVTVQGTQVQFEAAPDVDVRANGRRAQNITLQSDAEGATPTLMQTGSITFFLIQRGTALALRVRDTETEARKNFGGVETFPINGNWRINGTYVPYTPAKKLTVPTVVGTMEDQVCPGAFHFSLDGKEFALDAVQEPDEKDLFVVFADATSGKETYGTGRFLYVTPPASGSNAVTIDFNKAFNPPCAFTPYATCPLPPQQNRLPLRVEAGEKYHHPESA